MANQNYEQFTNNTTATLNGSINSSATTLSVVSAAGLPTTGQFRILIDSELMVVTNVSGTTLTVVRGAEGTAAASHADQAAITLVLTAASLVRAGERHPFVPNRAVGRSYTVKNEPGVLINTGAELTLLNQQGVGAGYVNSILLNITNSDYLGRERALIKIYIDGESTPSFSATAVGMHAADYLPNNNHFFTRYMGFSYTNASPYTAMYWNYFPIPFTTGIKIGLTNPSTTTASNIATCINYTLTPVAWDWGRMKRLKAFEQRINSDGSRGVSPYAQQDLLNVSGRGAVFMVYMLMDGGDSNYYFLEGNIKAYIDGDAYPGSPSIEWPGTEDFFLNGSYFNAGPFATDYVGTTRYDGVHVAGAYRLLIPDPITFDSSCRLTWNNGDSTEKTVTNNTYLSSTVLYYLDT